jgi:ATP-dependent DNA helicase DinG
MIANPDPTKSRTDANVTMDPAQFLGPEGPVASLLRGYEARPQQLAMAQAISQAFAERRHLVAEAGTGIGKSFAYLVPAVQLALQEKEKVVVSTYTIALQEQLIRKDIPLIHKAAGGAFTAVLAKGRGNYVCWRRLEQARKRQFSLFDRQDEINAIEALHDWALRTSDGSLSDVPFTPPGSVWELACSDASTCLGRRCNHSSGCFYQLARRKVFGADLIVANHALLFIDLALKQEGGSVLPKFGRVILDEAHNIENVASRHFGLRVTNAQVNYLLNRIYNPRTDKGLLAGHKDATAAPLVGQAQRSAEAFFNEVLNFHDAQAAAGGNGRVNSRETFVNTLRGPLNELGAHLRGLAEAATDEQEQIEFAAYGDRCLVLADELDLYVNQAIAESVYWVEATRRRYYPLIAVCTAPLHVGPMMKKALFAPCASVVMTSATLSTRSRRTASEGEAGAENPARGFAFFAARLGLEEYQAVQLGSPFDYQKQVRVFIEGYLPEPDQQQEQFLPAATEAIKKYLLRTQGKAFVLCTSFKQVRQLGEALREFCAEHQLRLLEQGKDKDRSLLLEEFRANLNSVLLGTDSFWQGVDVPGEALSNVIIFKLPFSVPDHPLLQARLERIRAEGGNPFFDYQLPEAILKFKQGFGRLIRTKNDTGIVVILDPRVITKRYGRQFLNALPPCPVEIVNQP